MLYLLVSREAVKIEVVSLQTANIIIIEERSRLMVVTNSKKGGAQKLKRPISLKITLLLKIALTYKHSRTLGLSMLMSTGKSEKLGTVELSPFLFYWYI